MSATQQALKAIAAVKIVEANRLFNEFENLKQQTSTLGTSLEDVSQLLEECCKFWQVTSIFKKQCVNWDGPIGIYERDRKLNSCQRMLERAKLDSEAQYLVSQVRETLEQEINREQLEISHARLLSREIVELSNDSEPTETGPTRAEQQEQLDHWRKLVVLTPDTVNKEDLERYLNRVFKSSTESEIALGEVRKSIESFSEKFRYSLTFDRESLAKTLPGIISTDTLSNEQQSILKEYLKDKNILAELADVLQMRYKSLGSWNWHNTENGKALRAFQQRRLNGKYRVFYDCELLDAILWHEIGEHWAVELREIFNRFYSSAWKTYDKQVFDKQDLERRVWFLKEESAYSSSYTSVSHGSVASSLNCTYKENYFMAQLPSIANTGGNDYGDEDDDDESSDSEEETGLSHSERKQDLLKLVAADVATYQYVQEPVSVVASDFKWFGPSMSHTTIFTVLKFFGMDDFWITAFEKFLNVPFQFDGLPVEHRARGVPVATSVSTFLTESVLFVLDFAVNQKGLNLFRLHDDLWLWGNPKPVSEAWKEILEFTRVTGLELNTDKTGSATDSRGQEESEQAKSLLPSGEVCCGFLKMNKDLKFEVDFEKFNEHIKEMKAQIDSCKSLFRKVRAYNVYTKFLLSNCFNPCRAFGVSHVEAIIKAFNQPIDPQSKSLLQYLSQNSPDSREWQSVPRGVWYWPINMGGLELHDPVVRLMQSRENLLIGLEDDFEHKAMLGSRSCYNKLKKEFENRTNKDLGVGPEPSAEIVERLSGEPFMSFEEFLKYRRFWADKGTIDLFNNLRKGSLDEHTGYTGQAVHLLGGHAFDTTGPIQKRVKSMNSYWLYIVTVFGPDLAKHFDNLQLAKTESVPLGLAKACASSKVRWTA